MTYSNQSISTTQDFLLTKNGLRFHQILLRWGGIRDSINRLQKGYCHPLYPTHMYKWYAIRVRTHFEGSQESSEDVDLYAVLPAGLGLSDALLEVGEKLLSVLGGHRGKGLPEQQDSSIYHRHAQRQGVRDVGSLGVGHVDRVGVVFQCS